jgi:DNA repair exonuclease SbcCD nuclease subunit
MAKFLHTADWQLGMVRHFFTPEVQGRYSAARLEGIRRIAEVADQEACDFVVVSGDVFEDNQLARSIVAQAIDALATFSVPIYLLPGNHDPLLSAGSVWDAAVMSSLPSNVHVLRDEQSVEVPGCEVEVVGAVWRTKHPNVDLVAETIANLEPTSRTRVLVGHGIVDVLSPDPTNPNLISVPTVESAIGSGLIQYVALGDRHSVTDVGSSGRIWYSGTQLVTNYVEVEPNHVLIVDVDRDACRVEKRRVSYWAFVERHFEVMGDDVGEVASWIDEIENKHQTVVKVSLSGSVSLAGKAIIDEALEMGADRLAAIEQWDRHSDLVVVPEDADFRDLGFGGFVEDAISELRDIVAGDGAEAGTADDALGLIIRLSRSGQ